MAVIGLVIGLIAGAGGLAFAFFTSSGAGTGSAQVGTASPVLINQIGGTPMYNSRITATSYNFSQCFTCVQMGEFGNKITFAGTGGPLNDVTVDMANFNTTPGPMNITFNIWNPSGTGLGTLIATDEQSFNIPAAPDGGYSSPTCVAAQAIDPNSDCGIANFSITFNFASQDITLPGTVVYGIQYNDAANAVNGGVNVQLANETTNVSVGTDADAGNLFADLASVAGGNGYDASYNDVGPGEITCSTVNSTFSEYSTASCDSGTKGYGTPAYIPAVEFDSTGFGDLYPAGPSQQINFSLTNPGATSATVNTVTIKVASDGINVEQVPGDLASAVVGCLASWFTVSPTPVPVNQTLTPGQTIDWNGAASISMSNPAVTQDACQGVNIGLSFTSN